MQVTDEDELGGSSRTKKILSLCTNDGTFKFSANTQENMIRLDIKSQEIIPTGFGGLTEGAATSSILSDQKNEDMLMG